MAFVPGCEAAGSLYLVIVGRTRGSVTVAAPKVLGENRLVTNQRKIFASLLLEDHNFTQSHVYLIDVASKAATIAESALMTQE